MTNSRIDAFRAMVANNPANPLARFGLANEALKAELWDEAVEHLQAYLTSYDDEGNGYGRLAQGLEALGRTEEVRQALRDGMAAASRFGHTGLANELRARLDEMEEIA